MVVHPISTPHTWLVPSSKLAWEERGGRREGGVGCVAHIIIIILAHSATVSREHLIHNSVGTKYLTQNTQSSTRVSQYFFAMYFCHSSRTVRRKLHMQF